MPRVTKKTEVQIAFIPDRASSMPLFEQIRKHIRQRILSGKIREGERLPSIRKLAVQCDVSADTAEKVYEELTEEGFLKAKRGSGFRALSPAELVPAAADGGGSVPESGTAPRILSAKAHKAEEAWELFRSGSYEDRPLVTYGPVMGSILEHEFTRLSAHIARSPWLHTYYSSPFGYQPLREAIARRLRQTRGILCSPDQIVITSGTVQSLNLAADILFEPGDRVWLEGPSLGVFSDIFGFKGTESVYVPVGPDGFDLKRAQETASGAKGVFVTPASQMPMSVTMPENARKELLSWALETGGWIIEEDTDNFMWPSGHPVPPIRSMPGAENAVLYLESFSLQFFPGIKTAYMLVPPGFEKAFAGARMLADRSGSEHTQKLLADFLNSDFFESYQRKVLKQFRDRFRLISELSERLLAPYGKLAPTKAGPHLALHLVSDLPDKAVSAELRRRGVIAKPLSSFRGAAPCVNGLNLGYGTFEEEQILNAIETMADVFEKIRNSGGIF